MSVLPTVQYTLINIPEMNTPFNFKEVEKSIENKKIVSLFSHVIEKKEIFEKQLKDNIKIHNRLYYSIIGICTLASASLIVGSFTYLGLSTLFELPIFSLLIPGASSIIIKMNESDEKKTIFQLELLEKKLLEYDKEENKQPLLEEILQICLSFDSSKPRVGINLEKVFSVLQEFLAKDNVVHHYISKIMNNVLPPEERNEAWKLLEKELKLNVTLNYLQINNRIVSRSSHIFQLTTYLRNNEISLTPETFIHIIPASSKDSTE